MGQLRQTWYSLRRAQAYSIPVVLSLALGIGVNLAVFSLLHRVIWRPLPFAADSELLVAGHRQEGPDASGSARWLIWDDDIAVWRQSRTLDDFAVYAPDYKLVGPETDRRSTIGARASSNLLRVLGVHPLAGRWFAPDDSTRRVVVLGEGLWRHRFGGNPGVLNATIQMDGAAWTVIGILPATGALPSGADYWTPLAGYGGQIVARAKPGLPASTVAAELSALSQSLPGAKQSRSGSTVVVLGLREYLFGPARTLLLFLLAITTLVLIATCANLGNLSLARTTARQQELATRYALGASRSDIAAVLFRENALLAVLAAALAAVLAVWTRKFLLLVGPPEMVRLSGSLLTPVTVAFLILSALAASIAMSIWPIFSAVRVGTQGLLQTASTSQRGRDGRRTRRVMVAAQLAVALTLVASANLVIQSLSRLTRSDHLGFDPAGVVIASVRPPQGRSVRETFDDALVSRLTARIAQLPGVRAVGFGPPPLVSGRGDAVHEGFDAMMGVKLPNQRGGTTLWIKQVDPGYFAAYGIPLRQGRIFSVNDGARSPRVIILNEAAARALFPQLDPIGRQYQVPGAPGPATVVGITGDLRQRGVTADAAPEILIPFTQRSFSPFMAGTVALRTSGSPDAAMAQLRGVIREVMPGAIEMRRQPLSELVDADLAEHRFLRLMLSVFAALGLVLGVVGTYSVIAYIVSTRRQEFGVRLALGAQRRNIMALVLREGAVLSLWGAGLGLAGMAVATFVLRSMLVGIHPYAFGVVGPTLLLAGVTLLATAVPGFDATRTQITRTLRMD
jgi:predicted permease